MADTKTLTAKFQSIGASKLKTDMAGVATQASKTEKATDKLGQQSKKTGSALVDGLGKGVTKVSNFLTGKGTGAVSKFLGSMGSLVTSIGGVKSAMVAMIAIGIVKFFNDASKAAADFNKQLSNVATLIPGNEERVKKLGNAIQQMAVVSGKSMADLTDATYQVISAFPELDTNAKVLDTLSIAAKASAAGMATTQDAVNLLSAVTKGYGDTSAEAVQKVSDLAFTTVKLGQTTFPELAASIGKAVPLAGALGIRVEELFAAEATLTGVTGGASEVTTQLASVMSSLLKPTADMQALMETVGAKTGPEFIEKAGGMKEAIDLISTAADDSQKPLGDFLGRKEAIIAALALAGAQSENYVDKLYAMENATGATAMAFREIMEGVNEYGVAINQTSLEFANLKTNMGQAVLPIKALLAEGIRPFITLGSELFRMFGNIISAALRIGKTLVTMTAGFQAVKLIFKIVIGYVRALANAYQYLDLYIKFLITAFQDKLAPALTAVKGFFMDLIEPAVELFNKINEGVPKIGALEAALYTVEIAFAGVGTLIDVANFAITTFLFTLKKLVDAAMATGPLLKNIFTGNWNEVGDSAKAVGDVFKELGNGVADNWNEMTDSISDRWLSMAGRVEAKVQELQGMSATAGPALNTEDLLGTDAEGNLTAFTTALLQMEEGLANISRNQGVMEAMGQEYDSAAESASLYSSTLDSLLSVTNLTGEELQTFITLYGNLAGVMDTTTTDINANADALIDLYQGFFDGQSMIERNAVAMEALGMAYDSTGASAELYQSTLSDMMESGDFTADQIETFVTQFGYLNEQLETTGDQFDSVGGKMAQFFSEGKEGAIAMTGAMDGLASGLGNIAQQAYLDFFTDIGSALDDGKVSSEEFGQIMADMGMKILQQLPTLFLQAGLMLIGQGMWPIGLGFIAAAGSTALISGYVQSQDTTANAKGNAFSDGNIIPFATGGIVSSPTLFPMSNGTGLMGEDGEEAIMPLSRGADGKLGVASSSGGGIKVVINNYSNESVSATETDDGNGGKQLEVVVGQIVKSQMSSGQYDNSMAGRYNVKVAGIR